MSTPLQQPARAAGDLRGGDDVAQAEQLATRQTELMLLGLAMHSPG